jgi:DNA polymerase III epsilon subunit-like protein
MVSNIITMNFTVSAPIRKKTILVFDVETSGLLPKKDKTNPNHIPVEAYPHILQLSYAKYDISTNQLVETYDTYIKVKKEVEISDTITALTGITRRHCNKGSSIMDAISQFYQAYITSDVIVAHNIDFDKKMILVELERNRQEFIRNSPECMTIFNSTYEELNGVEHYCSMRKGTVITNIMVPSKYPGKPPSLKWPRLNELYAKLFDGETVDGLHNAMVDVLVCLRCYMKMRHNTDCGLLMK